MSQTQKDGVAALGRGVARLRFGGAWRGAFRAAPSAILIYGAFVLLIALPLALVLMQGVVPGLFDFRAQSTALDIAPLVKALSSNRVLAMMAHSLELAATGAVTATVLGGAYAFLVIRCEFPGRKWIAVVPWVVFLTPSYLKSLAWVLLMSPGGYLAQLGLIDTRMAHGFFTIWGLLFVTTLSLFPLAAFITGSALNGLGSEYEDAARLAGAGPLRIWARINLPLLGPAIALSLIAIFAEGLSDFGMAATIARASRFDLLTYGIYAAASDYPVDFPLAGAQALILLCLVLVVVLADRLLRRQADPRLISGRSRPARVYDLGPWRWAAAGAAWFVSLLALGLPVASIAVRAFTRTLGAGITLGNFTARHILEVLSPGTVAGSALADSLFYAGLTAIIACAVALLLAVEVDRSRRVMRPLVLGISLGAVAIPGIVLAFGYILLWNRVPGFRDWPFPHYGQASLLVTGYSAAALPYCLILVLAAIGQLAPSLTDAARLQGVGRAGRLIKVTLPLIAMSMLTAFLLTFIRTVFELPISQLLIPLTGTPVPPLVVKLFNHDGDGLASALSLAAMFAAGGGAGLIWLLARRIVPSSGPRTVRPVLAKLGGKA